MEWRERPGLCGVGRGRRRTEEREQLGVVELEEHAGDLARVRAGDERDELVQLLAEPRVALALLQPLELRRRERHLGAGVHGGVGWRERRCVGV